MVARARHPLFIVAGLALLVGLVEWPIFLGRTWLDRDHLLFTLPSRLFMGEALSAGRLPLWTDRLGIGAPFAADPNQGFFYPPSWIVALVSPPLAADLLLFLHLLLAGIGTAWLARRLGASALGSFLAGAAFASSGVAAGIVVNAIVILSLAWMPWIAWASDKAAQAPDRPQRLAAALTLALLLTAQVLSGDPSCMLTTAWVALGITLARATHRRESLVVLGASYLASALLAGALVVPALFALTDSPRAGGLPLTTGVAWSLHPARLLEAVWPGFLGTSQGAGYLAHVIADASAGLDLGPNWMVSTHLGLPVVVLAGFAISRRAAGSRGLVVLAGALILIALGRFTPVYAIYRRLVLPEHFIRYPERHFLGVALIVCTLAGVGATRALAEPPSRRRVLAAMAAALGLGVAASAVFLRRVPLAAWLEARASAMATGVDARAGLEAIVAGATLASTACAILALGLLSRFFPRWSRLAGPLVVTAVVGLGVAHQLALLAAVERRAAIAAPRLLAPVLAARRPGAPPDRIYAMPHLARDLDDAAGSLDIKKESAHPNLPTIFGGLASVPGFTPIQPRGMEELWEFLAPAHGLRVLELLGVRYVVAPTAMAIPPAMQVRALSDHGFRLLENSQRRPRAFVTDRTQVVADFAALQTALARPGPFDPGLIHLLRGHPADSAAAPVSGTLGPPFEPVQPCQVESPTPEQVRLQCDSRRGGRAVLLDAFARGWTATVDGKPTAIAQADGLFRSVPVAAGPHSILFQYQCPGLFAGLWLSLVSLVLWIAMRLRLRRYRAVHNAGDRVEEHAASTG